MNLWEQPEVHARRWFLLGVLSLSLILVVMSVSGLNVALATLQRDVGVTGPQLQWIVNAYALAFGGLLFTGGAIGDRYGRKGALLGGLLVFGLGALLGGLATSASVILMARAAMGVGAAFVMPATLSLLIEVFPPPERPTAIAIWSGFAGGGGALGPLLTGLFVSGWWIVPSWGWEAGFLYNLPVVALVMVAVAVWLPRSREDQPRHIDPIGAGLSVVAVTALIYSIIEGPEQGWNSTPVLSGFLLAVTFGAALLVWQRRCHHPMLPLELFADPRLSIGSAVVTMTFVVLIGFWFLLVLYVQFVLGYSALEAGLATMPEALSSMLVAPFTAALAERFGSRRTMAAGFAVLALSFLPLSAVSTETSYWYLLGPLVLAGAGLSLAMTPATNDIMIATPYDKAGIGSAVNDTARELGAALGIATLGAFSTSIYRNTVNISELPPLTAAPAAESIGAAIETAQVLTDTGALSSEAATATINETGRAFTTAFAQTMAVAGIVSAVVAAALLVGHITQTRSRRRMHALRPDEHDTAPRGQTNMHASVVFACGAVVLAPDGLLCKQQCRAGAAQTGIRTSVCVSCGGRSRRSMTTTLPTRRVNTLKTGGVFSR